MEKTQCDLELLRFQSVPATDLLSSPFCKQLKISNGLETISSLRFATTTLPFLSSCSFSSFETPPPGASKSLSVSLYISRYEMRNRYSRSCDLEMKAKISCTACGMMPGSSSLPIIVCVLPDPVCP